MSPRRRLMGDNTAVGWTYDTVALKGAPRAIAALLEWLLASPFADLRANRSNLEKSIAACEAHGDEKAIVTIMLEFEVPGTSRNG